jgi:hypothetical protein
LNPPTQGLNPPAHGLNPPTQGLNPPAQGLNLPTHGLNLPTHGLNLATQRIARKNLDSNSSKLLANACLFQDLSKNFSNLSCRIELLNQK